MHTLASTPQLDGYAMPAEFDEHQRSWMLWPERTDIWPHRAKPAQQIFAEIAKVIAQFEPVTVGASARLLADARRALPAHIDVMEIAYNGCWIRDTGPVFVNGAKGEVRGVDWEFNAWGGFEGGLYSPWDLDNQVAGKVLARENIDRYVGPMVLEGGAIITDGHGTLLTTESCILNPNRNPGLNRTRAENIFEQFLGIRKVIWLKRGLHLDETGGHIDNLCIFLRPGIVLLAWTEDRQDPQYEISAEAYDILASTTDSRGEPITIVKVNQPSPIYIKRSDSESVDQVQGTVARPPGGLLPASYINAYFANGALLVPVFGDRNDAAAIKAISDVIADRKIVPVNTRELLFGGGNIHCNVLNQPRGYIR